MQPSVIWNFGSVPSLVLDILKGAGLALVASWLAVKGAIRQFSSQRWWERQEEAYRRIVENLSRMQLLLSRMDNAGAAYVSKEEQFSKWSEVLDKLDDLEQTYHESAFRISVGSTESLNKLVSNWYRAAPLGEGASQEDQLDRCRNAIKECHAVILVEAKKDLKLPR